MVFFNFFFAVGKGPLLPHACSGFSLIFVAGNGPLLPDVFCAGSPASSLASYFFPFARILFWSSPCERESSFARGSG